MSNLKEKEKRKKEAMTIDYIKEYLNGRDYMSLSFDDRIAAMQKLRKDIRNGKYD